MVLAAAPAAALVVSLPGALRLASDSVGFVEAWLATAGLACPLLALLIGGSRAARRAVLAVSPAAGVPLLAGTALWALAALPATAVLGAILKANTHHRALAGATFGALALAIHAASALVAWRLTALVLPRIRRKPTRNLVVMGLSLSAIVVTVASLASAALADGAPPPASAAAGLSALLVDGSLVLAAMAVAAFLDVPESRSYEASCLGSGALVFVTAVGLALTWRSPSLGREVSTSAPVAGVAAGAVGLSIDP
jgi:hypothetical protein